MWSPALAAFWDGGAGTEAAEIVWMGWGGVEMASTVVGGATALRKHFVHDFVGSRMGGDHSNDFISRDAGDAEFWRIAGRGDWLEGILGAGAVRIDEREFYEDGVDQWSDLGGLACADYFSEQLQQSWRAAMVQPFAVLLRSFFRAQ
jgi:hypothetical protein